MINLLPEDNKIAIKKEYIRRACVVLGCAFFSAIVISATILVCLLLLANSEKNNFNRYLVLSAERLSMSESGGAAADIEDINSKLAFLESESDTGESNSFFREIIQIKPKGVKINNLSYDNSDGGKILIGGTAEFRQGVLSFVGLLREDRMFRDAKSPVSNLLKEKNLDFTITVLIR